LRFCDLFDLVPAEASLTLVALLTDAVEVTERSHDDETSEIAGVAMITSCMSFFATCCSPGPAVST
jgi:hypothetical protein